MFINFIPAGLVTPLGIGTDRVWKNLVEGKCGITEIKSEGIQFN